MARKKVEELVYVEDLITQAEAELFSLATSGDWFLSAGYDVYGDKWEENIPRAPNGQALINLAAQYLFGYTFQDYQLGAYYCPIPDRMIVGARGTGKTTCIAIANALRAIFHPGHNWLHVAPSIEQARAMFDIILNWGTQGNFTRLFVLHTRSAPAPDIFIRPWNKYDAEPKFMFRSIGGHGGQPMELLRSLEAGIISADEAFRTFKTDYYVPILVGMSRGPNPYKLNENPVLKSQYQDKIMEIEIETDSRKRKRKREELDEWVESQNVGKQNVLTLSGNAGVWPIWWSRFEWGKKHPDKRWSVRWISEQNVHFTKSQRDFLAQQFENDPDGLRVEMYAERPIVAGGVFIGTHVDSMFDGDIDALTIKMVEEEVPGWEYVKHEEHGLIRYVEPQDYMQVGTVRIPFAYAAGSDPGTGRVPSRNSWVILGARLDGPPFKIVYVDCGNFQWSSQGTLDPWITSMKKMLGMYNFPFAHVAAEATGPQKGVHEVVWQDDLEVVPVNMSAIKASLIMQTQLMLSRNMIVGPNIELLAQQLISYEFNDRKLDQDWVMALLSLVYILWPYVADQFEYVRDEDKKKIVPRETHTVGRNVRDRDYRRNVRGAR